MPNGSESTANSINLSNIADVVSISIVYSPLRTLHSLLAILMPCSTQGIIYWVAGRVLLLSDNDLIIDFLQRKEFIEQERRGFGHIYEEVGPGNHRKQQGRGLGSPLELTGLRWNGTRNGYLSRGI